MNPPISIFTKRQRQNGHPPVARRDEAPTGPPLRSADTGPVGATLRITPLDVQQAWARNEPDDGVTVREVDDQIRDAERSCNPARVAILAEHRLKVLERQQRSSFPGDDGPAAA